MRYPCVPRIPTVGVVCLLIVVFASAARADGKLFAPRSYSGSLEERSQEAIIIFTNDKSVERSGFEDLVLKLTVEGGVDNFAWVVPFPSEPKVEKEDGTVFVELFNYVQARAASQSNHWGAKGEHAKTAAAPEPKPVEVLSRQVVGTYDVVVVRENESGALNRWLDTEGFRALEGGDDILEFYRQKGYVFACMKVTGTALADKKSVELHPLRFSFATGGFDGIYFPMKLTSLQEQPFLVNLHVFYGAWLNDHINAFGYEQRGFHLVFCDYDGPFCEPNAGKRWAAPESDPYLSPFAPRLATTAKLLAKLHPDEKFYLTNVQGQFTPAAVRQWKDDLFPYYVAEDMVPYDARPDGPAAGLYAALASEDGLVVRPWWKREGIKTAAIFVTGLIAGVVLLSVARRFRRATGAQTR